MANKDYSIVLNAQVDAQSIKDSLNKLQKQLPDLKLNFNTGDINNATKAVNDNVEAVDSAMLTYQQANLLLQDTIKIVKSMANEVYSLDSALTDYRKVSDLTGKSLDEYVAKLTESGQAVARTTSEMVEAATSFKQAGYTDEDSAKLAEYSSLMQNVADDYISASDAANILIAQMKAFNISADDSIQIVDKINEISNSYAVSSSDLSTNIGKVSSALAVGGNTLDDVLSLMTGGIEIVRNGSKVARGLVSVQSRWNQITDESSSTGQKLTEWYKKHNIVIYDQQGQLLKLYDVLKQTAEIWPTLSKNEKSYYLNTQAGANQTQNLASILENFDTVLKAHETSLNATGSAMGENAKYMQSLEARTTALKASFQELSNTVLDSELVATFLDLAKGALDLANNLPPAVIQFGLLSTGLTGALTIMQQFAKNGNLLALVLGKTTEGATAVTGAVGLLKGGLAGAIPTALALSAAIVAIYVAYQKYKEYTDQAARSVEDWQTDIDSANAKLEENKQKLEELNNTSWYDMSDDVYKEIESLEEENKALQEQIDKYTELRDKKAQANQKETDTLAYGVTKGAQWLGNVTQGYGNSSYYGTDLREKAYQVDVKGKYTGSLGIGAAEIANVKISDINQQLKAVNSLEEAYRVLEKATGKTKEQLDELGWSFKQWDYVVTDTAETYQTQLTENLKGYTQELEKNGEISKQDIQIYQQRLQNAEKIVDALKNEQAQGKTLTQTQLDLIAAYDNLKTATNLADMAFKTDQKTMQGLIQKYPVLQSYVTSVGGAYGLSASAVNKAVGSMIDSNGNLVASTKGMALQVYQALSAIIEMQQEASMTAQYAWQNAVKTGQSQEVKDKLEQEMNSARTQRDALIKTQQKLDAAFKKSQVSTDTSGGGSTGDTAVSSGGGGGGGGSSKTQTALEKQTTEYKNQISALEKQLSLLEEKGAAEEEQIEVMKKIQDKLHEQAQYYRSQGVKENDEMIVDLQISWQKYSKKIVELQQQAAEKVKEIWRKNLQSQIDSLSTRKDELENLFKGIASAADDEIDKLEKQKQAVEDKYDAQINALKETNNALNDQLELETAIDNLERAKSQKVLVYKDGKYQYIDDADAVSEASSNLESIKRQQAQEAEQKRLERLKDKEVADIEAQIKAWQDYRDSWTALYSDYSDTQNKLLAEQMLGTKLEGQNWKDRIGQLQEFRTEYNKLVSQIGSLQTQLDKGMDTDTTDWSQVWRDAENNKSLTQAERESIQNYAHAQKVQQMAGSGYTYDSASGTWNKHAKGTLNAPGGLTLVGEKGPELGILPKGSGVIPADITKNLWDWGKTNPLDFFKGKLMQESMQNQNISIQNLSLPEVTNGEEFVEYMRKNFWRKTIQFSTNN